MIRKLVYLIMIMTLVTVSSCARKPESIDSMALLGLTEEQIINQLGKPDVQGDTKPGEKEFFYKDIRFRVFLEDGITTACYISDASPIPLNDQIRCGVSIEKVLEMYGSYESEADVEKDMKSSEYVKGILYHKWLSQDTERYQLRYSSKQLLFTFYPNKTLHSVLIGKIF